MGLILTRRLQQGIWIGDNIRVSVRSINEGEVALDINAPGLVVDRDEVRERKLNKERMNSDETEPHYDPELPDPRNR